MSEVVTIPPRESGPVSLKKPSAMAAFALALTIIGIALHFMNVLMGCIVFRYTWDAVGRVLLELFTRRIVNWAILLVLPGAALLMLRKKKTQYAKVGMIVNLCVLGLQALAVFICFVLTLAHCYAGVFGNLIGLVAGSDLLSKLVLCFHRISVGYLDFFGVLQVFWYLAQSLIALLFIAKNVLSLLAYIGIRRNSEA